MNYKPVIILGAGDFGAVASVYLREAGIKVEAHIVDDARYKTEEKIDGVGVAVCATEEIERHFSPRYFDCIVAIGYSKLNANRVKKCEQMAAIGYELRPFVHPGVHPHGRIGRGAFVFERNTIQPYAEIGDYCVLWSGNHIGHHASIGRGAFITSHVCVSSRCAVGERSFLGVNSTLTERVTLGAACIVQAGAVVDRNLPDESVYARDGLSKVPSSRVKL